ncbi:hypothetical protein BSPWISOXPB_2081, partial [uncultured Gammaproteobacteria bacterium]
PQSLFYKVYIIVRIVFIVKSIRILLYLNVGNIKQNSIKLLLIFIV